LTTDIAFSRNAGNGEPSKGAAFPLLCLVTLTGTVTDFAGFQNADALQLDIDASYGDGSNYSVTKTLSQDGKTISLTIVAVLSDQQSTQDEVGLIVTDVFGSSSSASTNYIF
jgi:hypothetical protein